MIWEGTSEELNDWIDRVIYKKESQEIQLVFDHVEG